MVEIPEGTDLLIYDTAIMDDAPAASPGHTVFFQLPTIPSRLGEVAARAQARAVLLSHLAPITEPNLAEIKRLIRAQGHEGKIRTARDLMVLNLGGPRYHDHDDDHNEDDDRCH